MGLETGQYISDLNIQNPESTDKRRFGDDHLRLIKQTLKNTFPNFTGVVEPTEAELNFLVGVTSSVQDQLDTKLTAASIDLTPYGKLAVAQAWTKTQRIPPVNNGSGAGTVILNMANSTSHIVTAIGALTISFSGLSEGQEVFLKIIQGAGGSHAITLPGNMHFPFKTAPTFSTAVGDYDIIAGKYIDGIIVAGFLPQLGIS